ncbi:PAS domain S-box protein, partial [Patescibacteria group bacterium]
IIKDINELALKILGYQRGDLIETDALDLHTEEYRKKCENNIYAALSGKRACCDCPYIKSDGSTVFSDSLLSELEIDGEKFVLVSFHDITRQVELDKNLKEEIGRLEKINEILTGREARIIELKQEMESRRYCDSNKEEK